MATDQWWFVSGTSEKTLMGSLFCILTEMHLETYLWIWSVNSCPCDTSFEISPSPDVLGTFDELASIHWPQSSRMFSGLWKLDLVWTGSGKEFSGGSSWVW